MHELAYAGDELWLAATRFSCLATLDREHSFVPRWRPPFVSELAGDDRCHLSGLATVGERVGFVTALGESDAPGGWRERKLDGGCVIAVPSGEVVARGLSPPTPRAGTGTACGSWSPGGVLCARSIPTAGAGNRARAAGLRAGSPSPAGSPSSGSHGCAKARATRAFRSRGASRSACGVWIVDVERGEQVGFLRFEERITEVFDVALLAGIRFPSSRTRRASSPATRSRYPTGALAPPLLDHIAVARDAVDRVDLRGVLAAAAVDLVGRPVDRVDPVLAAVALDLVLGVAALDPVLAGAAGDLVLAAVAVDLVLAGGALDLVLAALSLRRSLPSPPSTPSLPAPPVAVSLPASPVTRSAPRRRSRCRRRRRPRRSRCPRGR